MRNKIIKYGCLFWCFIHFLACDNSGEMLDDFLNKGPIIYAAKIDTMSFQSGFYRVRVNIVPGEDVNRSYCMLKWNITSEIQDSMKVEYNENNFDVDNNCYFVTLDLKESEIQGNLEIKAQNYDTFGNKSLVYNMGTFVYGSIYVSALLNDPVSFSEDGKTVFFERRNGSVGNYISYQQTDGSFTEEVYITENEFLLDNALSGGRVKSKTQFLINESDIDYLQTKKYQETLIP